MDEKQRQHLESQLSAYLDNELSERERQEVEAFLAEYADARALLAELRSAISAVQKLPRAKASEQLIERLRTRMERDALLGHAHVDEPTGRGPFVVAPRWIAAAAVIMLAFVTAYLILPFSRSSAPKHDQLAYRDQIAPSEVHEAMREESAEADKPSELTLGKRITEEVAKEDAARPIPPAVVDMDAHMRQSEKGSITPAAPAALPAVEVLADDLKDESRISAAAPLAKMRAAASRPVAVDKGDTIELAFADQVSRGRYLEALSSKANGEGWVLQAVVDHAERTKNESTAEASLHFELMVPGEVEHKRILDEAAAQVQPSLSPASQPGESAELAPAEQQASTSAPGGSLQANKAVAVAPQTKPSDSAGAAYLLRLRVKTAGAATQPAKTTLPASDPSE